MNRQQLMTLKDEMVTCTAKVWSDGLSGKCGANETLVNLKVFGLVHELVCRELQLMSDNQPNTPIQGHLVSALQHLNAWLEGRGNPPSIIVQAAHHVRQAILSEGGAS